jgi:hypothetical protein
MGAIVIRTRFDEGAESAEVATSEKECEFESAQMRCTQYNIYVIEFVSDLRQAGGFLRVLRFSSTNKTDRHDRYN